MHDLAPAWVHLGSKEASINGTDAGPALAAQLQTRSADWLRDNLHRLPKKVLTPPMERCLRTLAVMGAMAAPISRAELSGVLDVPAGNLLKRLNAMVRLLEEMRPLQGHPAIRVRLLCVVAGVRCTRKQNGWMPDGQRVPRYLCAAVEHQSVHGWRWGLPEVYQRRSNVPPDLGLFVGRVAQLNVLEQHRSAGGLLVLCGPRGIGTSRLARHWLRSDPTLYAADRGVIWLAPSEQALGPRLVRATGLPVEQALQTAHAIGVDGLHPRGVRELQRWQQLAPNLTIVVTGRRALPGVSTEILPPLSPAESEALYQASLPDDHLRCAPDVDSELIASLDGNPGEIIAIASKRSSWTARQLLTRALPDPRWLDA